MDIYSLNNEIPSEEVGNKAANLAFMKSRGFNVPGGIVLGREVFTSTVSGSENRCEVEALLSSLTKENAAEISKKIRELYSDIRLPRDIISKIGESIDKTKKYAVRSSGIKEDLVGFSFAGQYDTFINISDAEAIAEAVIGCYLSAYSETVLFYLASNGMSSLDAQVAVIIEEMVDSEVSGVIFTVNPTSGCDREIYIEAAEGQGENLVSGKVSAERFAYNTLSECVTEASGSLLSEANIREIAEVAGDIQELFGYPCDIEFAYEGGKLYILQARAVTKILYGGIADQWTTADFKDGGVSATVCTPYMWSLYEYIWESELRKFIIESKILKPAEIEKKLGDMFYGRPYWNLSVVKAAMAKVPGYKEREFDSDLGVKITYGGDGKTTALTPKSLIEIARIAIEQRRIVKTRRENAERLKGELLETYFGYFENKDRDYTAEELKALWKKLIFTDYLKSESTYFRQIFINTIHQSLFKDKIMKHCTEGGYFALISGLDNISHLLPFYEMWRISRKIKGDAEACAIWEKTPSEVIAKELSEYPYGGEVEEYIAKFGYHSKKELDVTYPSFYEDVCAVVEDLKSTVMLGDECAPEKDTESLTSAFDGEMASVKAKTPERTYKKFEKDVLEMRKMLWWREEFRDVSTRFYCIIRAYTMRLAELLVAEGVIGDASDIWFTKIEDIRRFLEGEITSEELRKIVKKNRKYYNSFRNYTNENEIGAAFSGGKAHSSPSDKALHGIGTSRLSATGTARVIHSLDETYRLREGDILITKFTDTGWTGKFAMLSGIVTEYGGILCHAAIVSREYGIPCVVCAENATKLIKDGETVTINGETGEIILGGKK